MWYLINSTGIRLYLGPNEKVTFGRKKTNILLQYDESISRLHACISVEPRETMKLNEPTSICKLKDMGSKYGTYILLGEEVKIEVSENWYNLKNQDRIQFGLQHHIFTVIYMPIITLVSTLNKNEKKELQNIIDDIDGMIVTDWSTACTHLTVSKAALTEKVTWAMASAVPIVNLDYWKQFKNDVKKGKELPKFEDFIPSLSESLINKGKVSLCPNERRKTLFQNLIFVHFSACQYKIYGKMINIAGGKSLLYSKKRLTSRELCAPNVVILQCSNNDATQSTQCVISEYDSIYNALRAKKRRMISESEIPLAILHCSTDKYCNPKFKFGEFLKRPDSKPDLSKILVLDTQNELPNVIELSQAVSNVPVNSVIIPESYDSSYEIPRNDSTCQWEQILKSSTSKINQEKQDVHNCNVSNTEGIVKNVQKIKITKYIPETNDLSMLDCTQKDTQCSIQATQNLEKQNTNKQNIEPFETSVVTSKETPFNEIIDLTEDEYIESKDRQLNEDKCNETLNIFFNQGKMDKLLDEINVRDKSPEINLSEKRDILLPKENHKKSLKLVLDTLEENNESSKKRSKHSSNVESEDEYLHTSKMICTGNSDVEDTVESSCIEDRNNYSVLSKSSSSFLRVNPSFKKFKKIYNKTPKRRITLNDMYIWNRCNV